MGLIPDEVRAVYFDAVGTLIFPDPPVAEAYHAAGLRHGSRLSLDEVRRGFYAAFAAEEKRDAASGNRTSMERERQRWEAIVRATFPDVALWEHLYAELWMHFAEPDHWRAAPEAGHLLAGLRARGIAFGVASNFDSRLHLIILRKPEFAHVDRIVDSESVGWRKPAPEFFHALCVGFAPHQVLLVGDDRVNDYDGARAAGLHAVLLDETVSLTDLLS